jgi:hypothetical protein
MLETQRRRWFDLGFRRATMATIEGVAVRVEHDLRRQLASSDSATDQWVRETTRRIASAFRLQKRALVTPKTSTMARLITDNAQNLVYFASGNWSALPQADAQTAPKSRAYSILRTAVAALVPLALVATGIAIGFWPHGIVRDASVAAAVAWVVVTILASFDPLFHEKLAAIKTVREIVPF